MMQTISIQKSMVQIKVNEFIRSVYNWMALGLGLTGLIAFYISNNQALTHLILGNQLLFFGLIIGELILVFSISARIQNMRASTATGLFLLYAALNGVTLSFIFLFYTRISIASVFFYLCCNLYCLQSLRLDN
jgi:FtsH-binding integral membrane protein